MLALTGCASLMQGTSQPITFHLSPQDIKCAASRDNVDISQLYYNYNTLYVTKGRGDIWVKCMAEGYVTKTVKVKSATQPTGVVGGFFFDYGVTDMATGAMWKYPNEVTIKLEKDRP